MALWFDPGEILAEEFLRPLALTEYRLAKGLRVPARRINEIVHGKGKPCTIRARSVGGSTC